MVLEPRLAMLNEEISVDQLPQDLAPMEIKLGSSQALNLDQAKDLISAMVPHLGLDPTTY